MTDVFKPDFSDEEIDSMSSLALPVGMRFLSCLYAYGLQAQGAYAETCTGLPWVL